MRKKQFKAESKKLLDMMINSIYTHKEIFLRELISNASDAIDKLYFKSLTDDSGKLAREDFKIHIDLDKENRTIKISDNGIGMTAEELENNLGTIAKSGSFNFKKENADNDKTDDISVIGQCVTYRAGRNSMRQQFPKQRLIAGKRHRLQNSMALPTNGSPS